MARIRRRTMTLLLAFLAAVSLSLALPRLTFADGSPDATNGSYPETNPKGSRCQCGWK